MGEETVENSPQEGYAELADEWIVRAWRLWAGGLKNWSAIAREVGHDRETVKKRVNQYKQTLRAVYDGPDDDPRLELIEGLSQDLEEQDKIAREAELAVTVREAGGVERVEKHADYRTRTMARGRASEARKDIAGVRGVVTSRAHQTHEFKNPERVLIPVHSPDDPIAAAWKPENEIHDNAPDEPVEPPAATPDDASASDDDAPAG